MRDHKTKLISIPKLKPSLFQLHNFDPYTEVKSSSIPNIKQVNFDASTKTKSFSTPTQKVNNDSRTKKQVHFDTNTKNKSNSIQRLKLSHFRPHTKTQSISSLQWIQVKFDPPHWNEVKFDPPRWYRIKSTWITRKKNEVNFYDHPKDKWFSAGIHVSSQLLAPI